MAEPNHRAQVEKWLIHQDPGENPTMFIRNKKQWGKLPDGMPDDSIFKELNGVGVWLTPKGVPLRLDTDHPTGREFARIMGEYEKKPGIIEQLVAENLVDKPKDLMNAVYAITDPNGTMSIENRNAGIEGARLLASGLVVSAGVGLMAVTKGKRGVGLVGAGASAGAASMGTTAAMNQVMGKALMTGLWDFTAGAVISRGSSALFGPEKSLQTREEATRDAATDIGSGVGIQGGMAVGRSFDKLMRAATPSMQRFITNTRRQLKNWSQADRVFPNQLRFFNTMVHQMGQFPNAWWAAGGAAVGGGVGFKAGGDEDMFSVPGVISVMAPGLFNAFPAWRSGRVQKDIGMVDVVPGIGGSPTQAAYSITEAIEKLPIEQQEKHLANLAIQRGMYNNSSRYSDGVNTASSHAFTGNERNMIELNRAHGKGAAARAGSELGYKQSQVLFQGQFREGDLLDTLHAVKALKNVKGLDNPLVDELAEGLTGLTKFKKADLHAAVTGQYMAKVEGMIYGITKDSKKLVQFSSMLSEMKKAALNNPDRAPMLERTIEKLKSVYINEGIFGKAYSSVKQTVPGDITPLLFDGSQILKHLHDNETVLKSIFGKQTPSGLIEYDGLEQVARLMEFHQKGTLDQGQIIRDIEGITSFFTHRLAFVFASGTLSGGTSNPLASAMFGTALLYGAKSAAAVIIGGNHMSKMARRNPRLMRQYVNASIAGDYIREAHYFRALIRDTNPEATSYLGLGSKEPIQEQSGVTSGLAGRFFPFNKIPAGSPQ